MPKNGRREDVHRLTGERSIEFRESPGASSTSGGFTPQYASPEQFDGTVAIGPPSDVYSLGAILYKLLTGVPPLTATTLGEIRQAGLKGDFPPPKVRNRCVPKPLQAICLKAMRTDPEKRYGSPELLAADVEAFLANAPVSAHEEDLLARSARFIRHNWPVVFSSMAVLLVITLFSFFTAYWQRGLRENAHESSISRLKLAAALAAQACGAEIDRRWRLLELEAASPLLIRCVESLNSMEKNPEADAKEFEPERNDDIREDLQAFLTDRYVAALHTNEIKFENLFVNGNKGKQLARVPRSKSIGENYAYRHYFHGQNEDFPREHFRRAVPTPCLVSSFHQLNYKRTDCCPHSTNLGR